MSLAKGKYGIEYNPNQMKPDSSGLGWIVVVVVIIAVISLGWTLFCRLRVAADGSDAAKVAEADLAAERAWTFAASTASTSTSASSSRTA